MDLLTAVGFAANLLSIVFYISPTLIIVELVRNKETKRVPYLLFCATIMNCLFWFVYGIQKNFWAVYVNNGIGLMMNSVYLCLFICHVQELKVGYRIFLNISVFTFIMLIIFTFLQFIKNEQVTGIIAMIFNIVMFFSSLQKIFEVFRFRDNSYIPFLTILSLMFACFLWLVYGILQKKNMYLIIPNGLGLAISLFQVILWFIYNNFDKNEKSNTSEDELSKQRLLEKEEDEKISVKI
jgi:solute carrier family 50 protein (sugar transporter)